MKHYSLMVALAMGSALIGANSAQAGAEVGSWYVAPKAVFVNPDKDYTFYTGSTTANPYKTDSAFGGSLAVGKVLSQNWDVELGYVYSSHKVSNAAGAELDKLKLRGLELVVNRVFMRDSFINPFIGAGINSMNYRAQSVSDAGVPQATRNQRDGLGYLVKAGALVDVTSDGALQISAEVGQRSDGYFSSCDLCVRNELRHQEDLFAGLGIHYNFGFGGHAKAAPAVAAAPVAAPAPAPMAAPVAPPPPPPPPAPADSDHDGVVDSADRCPGTVAGAAVDATGCELDNDKDRVVNRLDKCPTTPAGDKVDAVGCSLSMALEVQFDTGKATIKPESNGKLDEFVQFLKDVPSANGELEGHTDNVGKKASNQSLSQRRAEAVKAYVVGKGVDAARLTAKGYGDTKPVADNKTVDGRAANRRVVFTRSGN